MGARLKGAEGRGKTGRLLAWRRFSRASSPAGSLTSSPSSPPPAHPAAACGVPGGGSACGEVCCQRREHRPDAVLYDDSCRRRGRPHTRCHTRRCVRISSLLEHSARDTTQCSDPRSACVCAPARSRGGAWAPRTALSRRRASRWLSSLSIGGPSRGPPCRLCFSLLASGDGCRREPPETAEAARHAAPRDDRERSAVGVRPQRPCPWRERSRCGVGRGSSVDAHEDGVIKKVAVNRAKFLVKKQCFGC